MSASITEHPDAPGWPQARKLEGEGHQRSVGLRDDAMGRPLHAGAAA